MEIIHTKRGAPALIINAYKFRRDRQLVSSLSWRCATQGCTSRCATDHTMKDIKTPPSEHNHESLDQKALELERVRTSVKRKAESTLDSANTIVYAAAAASSCFTYKDTKKLRECVYRARLKQRPAFEFDLNLKLEDKDTSIDSKSISEYENQNDTQKRDKYRSAFNSKTNSSRTTKGVNASSMKAARIQKYGGPEVLKLETNVPKPGPLSDTQVLIKAAAAGVNPVDDYIMRGNFAYKPPLPWVPGWDAAGIVEAVGPKVTRLQKRDRVYCAGTVSGAYAEYVVAEERQTGKLGTRLTFSQGAGVGVPYYTAYRAYLFAKAKAGETVLIHGASGAVGMACVQLLKSRGLRVFGTAGAEQGQSLLKSHGIDKVFNHRQKGYEKDILTETGGKGVDIIIEMLASVNLARDLELIVKKGRIVLVGSRGEAKVDPGMFLFKEPIVTGVALPESTDIEWHEMTAAIEAGISEGWVKPIIAKEYPLADASKAVTDVIADHSSNPGKLVLTINKL